MRLSRKHARYGKELLYNSKLISGARIFLRGAARRSVSTVSEAPTPPCAIGDDS